MILAIDVGNTNIVVGCIDDLKTYFIERLSTNRTKTELEYAVDLKNVLDIYHIKKTEIEGCIISSVVPQITNIVKLAAEKILKKNAIVLGPGVKTGLNIMILPGVGVSLDALTARASQLSGISIDAPRHVIGKNTIECMKSGVLYSNAAALDGIIDRIEEELGEKATVVATGGLAKKIVPHCKREIILDEELLLRGLLIIYEKNK